jgi:hypothetical protein
MSLSDCLLLTLANVTICITLPKVLSLICAPKTKLAEQIKPILNPELVESSTPSFPY